MARNGGTIGGIWGLFLESALKFTNLLGAIQLFRSRDESPIIDNAVFQLHYRTTSLSLLASSLFISAYQYIGNPIDCFGQPNSTLQKLDHVIDNYCWMHGTFVQLNFSNLTQLVPKLNTFPTDELSSRFYQYVCFILFLQALCFYAPHYVWKSFEESRLENLLLNLNNRTIPETTRKSNIKILENYYRRNLHNHQGYVAKFFICEVLNLVNVIFQIILTDRLVDGEFTSYGLNVVTFLTQNQKDRVDPMMKFFPRMTKCQVYFYGSGEEVVKQNFMCILPLNVASERIYVFMWLWFIVLAGVTVLQLLYTLLTIFKKDFRNAVLKSRARLTSSERLDLILSKAYLGDWFILLQLNKNMDPIAFQELIEALCPYQQDDHRSARGDGRSKTTIVTEV